MVHSAGSLLTDKHLKGLSNTDFVYLFQQRAFLRMHVTHSIRRCAEKLGHDILPCVSKHFDQNNLSFVYFTV